MHFLLIGTRTYLRFYLNSKALDVVLPKREAEPFVKDFKYLSARRFMIRTLYDQPGQNLKQDSKKVQRLIDEAVRSLKIMGIMVQREVTYNNFLG